MENNIKFIFYNYYMEELAVENEIVSSTICVEKLEKLKNTIEAMDKLHQIEILKIITNNRNKNKINENKSGVFVNLSFLPQNTIQEMLNYIDYIKDQEETINIMEYQKSEFENSFFVEKEDKDNSTIQYNSQ
jgi:hypothetical protein